MEEEKEIPSNSVDEFFNMAKEANDANAQLVEQHAYLVHRIFAQSKDGCELLEAWAEALLMIPVARTNSTKIEIGIQEGINTFVRNIINTCKSVEAETNK